MKKTVLAMLAGMVCAISFACISGGNDYSGEGGNSTGTGNMPGDSGENLGGVSLNVSKVTDADYLGYDICLISNDGKYCSWTRLILRGSPNKTLVYIAEVNGEKHVESPSFSNNDGTVSFSSTVYNRKTIHLPLRVKVGLVQAALPVGREEFFVSTSGENSDDVLTDFCDVCRDLGGVYNDQRYYQPRYAEILSCWRKYVRNTVSDFSLLLQYQVAGSSSWTTVSRTRFSDIQQQVFQWQKSSEGVQVSKPKYYFLNGTIDGDFPAGTTLLIRIVAESRNNDSPTNTENSLSGWQSFPEKRTWTKQMTSTSFTEHGDYLAGYVNINHYLWINGFSPGLNTLYSLDDETGDLNWCPLQWMAVTIGEGRRPE